MVTDRSIGPAITPVYPPPPRRTRALGSTGPDQERRTVSDRRAELLDIVREHGYLRLDEPIQLRSGEWSRDFVDGKRALANGAHLEVACRALVDLVAGAGIDFDAVGGLTMGADQFAHGVAIVGGCDWFVVRKEAKGRGTNRLVEGSPLGSGVRVLLVDDVVTTGGSIKQAWQAVTDTGAQVVAAVTLLDRGDEATAWFAEIGVPYLPLLTYLDLGIEPVGRGRADAPTAG
jgi:orotate phosphoribosyltransferase